MRFAAALMGWAAALLAAALATAGAARAVTCEEIAFPTGGGPPETAWRICVIDVGNEVPQGPDNPPGLMVGPVHVRTGPDAPWIKVIHDMRVSEIFVPYHPGQPRYFDLAGFGFTLGPLTGADCPAATGGTLLRPTICREIRERGVIWKDAGGVRRGQEAVVWGAIFAANYRYLMEYRFRDDGTILGRLGATGQNLPGSEHVAHTHTGLWRIDIDLGAPAPNRVRRWTHHELEACGGAAQPPPAACDLGAELATAQGLAWSPRRQPVLEVVNPGLLNRNGNPVGYRLMPLILAGGLGQHQEAFTRPDLWVTLYWRNGVGRTATSLPGYVAGAPDIRGRDVVLWVKGTAHHHPRDEDGVHRPSGTWMGTTHAVWSGFVLHPHNLFGCSPLYQPCPPRLAAPAAAAPHAGDGAAAGPPGRAAPSDRRQQHPRRPPP